MQRRLIGVRIIFRRYFRGRAISVPSILSGLQRFWELRRMISVGIFLKYGSAVKTEFQKRHEGALRMRDAAVRLLLYTKETLI